MGLSFPNFPLLITFLIFIFTILKIITKKRSSISHPIKSSTPNLPPGPWRLPIVGNLHHLVGSDLPHHRLRGLAKKYGPLMHLQLGEVSHIVVSSGEITKEIMTTYDINFAQRPSDISANIYDSMDIIFSPYGDYWKQVRRVCTQELSTPKRVQSFQSIREEEVSNLIGFLHSNQNLLINLSDKIFSMAYSITARAAFGMPCKDQEGFIAAVEEGQRVMGAGFSVSDLFPSQSSWLRWITGMELKSKNIFQKVEKIIENIIHEHNKDKATRIIAEPQTQSLLDVLLKFQRNGDLGFSLETDNIKAIIMNIFFAASDTSSTSVEWTMSEMLKNPIVMEKAQAEVRQVYGGRENVVETELHKLEFLDLVIKETLRLHPPGPLLPRESRESCVINGYELPAKTKLIINTWAMGRDPKHWTEPERFQPERFLDTSVDYNFKGDNFEFIPFGAGKRMCPGILFAIPNMKLPLAQLLFHFDWKLPDGITHENFDMNERFGFTVRRKRDLYLVAIPYGR